MLDSESVYANSQHFTPLMCCQITWAVINDSRQYFFWTVTEQQLTTGQVRWPTSLLMHIIGADVQACREIRMGNFPQKWSTIAMVGTLAGGQLKRTLDMNPRGAFNLLDGLPLAPPRVWPQAQGTVRTPTPEQAASAASNRIVTIRYSNIHAKFLQLMARYISHFRSVQLKTLLKVANITKERLPMLPKYMKNGKNILCYSYLSSANAKVRCVAKHRTGTHWLEIYQTPLRGSFAQCWHQELNSG